MSLQDLSIGALLKATAVLAILCAGCVLSWELLRMSLAVPETGAVLGCSGVVACRVLEGHSRIRRCLVYVCIVAFLVCSFVLLMQSFEVSGAIGFCSQISVKGRLK
jgi:hypothetical protein